MEQLILTQVVKHQLLDCHFEILPHPDHFTISFLVFIYSRSIACIRAKMEHETIYLKTYKMACEEHTMSHFSYTPLIKCKISRKRNMIVLFLNYQRRKAHLYLL